MKKSSLYWNMSKVDLIIVGWFGTTAGISAVSTGSNLVNLVVFTVTGLSMGSRC